MPKTVNFNSDRTDTWGGLIPSDSEVLYVLEVKQKPLTVKEIRRELEKTKGADIRTVHVSNTLTRFLRAKKVNKHVRKEQEHKWRIGWGVIVNMDTNEFKEPKPQKRKYKKRPIKKNGVPVIEKQEIMTQPQPIVKAHHNMQYATDTDRINYAKHLGYKTIAGALKDIGSWEFEKKLKAYLKFNSF